MGRFIIIFFGVFISVPLFAQDTLSLIKTRFDSIQFNEDSTSILFAGELKKSKLHGYAIQFDNKNHPLSIGKYKFGKPKGIWIFNDGSTRNSANGYKSFPGCGTGVNFAIDHFHKTYNSLFIDVKINLKGIQIFQVKKSAKQLKNSEIDNCSCCFNPKIKDLLKNPIIEESDIDSFDYGNQHIRLKESGRIKLQSIKPTTIGTPLVLTLNGEIIYGFWLWYNGSSEICERVYTYNYPVLKLKFGLPSHYKFGEDPRYNKELEQYLLIKK